MALLFDFLQISHIVYENQNKKGVYNMAKYGIKSHILMETRKMACMEILLPKRKRSKKFAFLQQKKHVDDTWCYYRVQEIPDAERSNDRIRSMDEEFVM